MRLKKNEKQYVDMVVLPLLVAIIVILAVFSAGYKDAATVLSFLAPCAVVLYVAVVDGKKRWPNTSVCERMTKVMTFKR